MKVVNNPLESIRCTIAFDSKDYSISSKDAWIYGIVMGWDEPSLKELGAKFRWRDEEVARLKVLHVDYVRMEKGFNTEEPDELIYPPGTGE